MFMFAPRSSRAHADLAQHHDRGHLVLHQSVRASQCAQLTLAVAVGGGGSIVDAPGKHAAREIYWSVTLLLCAR